MRTSKLKISSSFLAGAVFLSSLLGSTRSARADVFLDQENDPLPMFEMTVIFPVGFEAMTHDEVGVANLFADILEGGTAKTERQEFLEKLADFGANLDFTVGNQYTHYSLSFPIVAGKNYDQLISVLKENWQTPRFEPKTFELARTKLKSALQASLDSDFTLASSTLRRWFNRNYFAGFPISLEAIDRITLPQTAQIFERDFAKVKNIWVGVVAPQDSAGLVDKIMTQVFHKQGKIVRGPYLKVMPTVSTKKSAPVVKRELLILDKDQRAQTVTTLMAVSPNPLLPKEELAFFFGNHILFDSGLASIFSDEIRTKRGLAYSVGSGAKQLFTLPVLGVSMNPVRERASEALETLAKLVKDSFETGKTIQELPQEIFDRQLTSFRNSKILGAATPGSRLSERSNVISGELSAQFYLSEPESWKVTREEVNSILGGLWKKSGIILAIVGDAKELKPLAQKFFPDYKISVIPYKETILEKTYP